MQQQPSDSAEKLISGSEQLDAVLTIVPKQLKPNSLMMAPTAEGAVGKQPATHRLPRPEQTVAHDVTGSSSPGAGTQTRAMRQRLAVQTSPEAHAEHAAPCWPQASRLVPFLQMPVGVQHPVHESESQTHRPPSQR